MYRSKNDKILIGITLGDPAGIGAEVVLKSLCKFKIPGFCKILLIGDSCLINSFDYDIEIPVYADIKRFNDDNLSLGLLDVGNMPSDEKIKYGEPSIKYGRAAYDYLIKAVELLKLSQLNRLITAPVNKNVISSTGINFLGHTEFLAKEFQIDNVVMLLLSGRLKFALLTRHLPLKDVSGHINSKKIEEVIYELDKGLEDVFNIKHPKIGVAGLNPHVGDEGLIGKEEKEIIGPVIKKISSKYNIKGPFPAYKLIREMQKEIIDVVLCMYHDQALLPLKLLSSGQGVNITLGLPFIRTSPFHGTAYDIAGKNIASCDSMLETIRFTLSV